MECCYAVAPGRLCLDVLRPGGKAEFLWVMACGAGEFGGSVCMVEWVWVVVFLVGAGVGVGSAAARCAWLARRRRESSLDGNVFDVRAVFDQMTDGVSILDMTGELLVMNKAIAGSLGLVQRGYSRAELLSLFDIVTPEGEVLAAHDWPTLRALRGDFVQALELQTRHRETGATRTAIYTTAPIRDHAGKTVQILLLWRDITDRKQSDMLREQLAAIVESSEDAIVGKDWNGIVTSWNRGAEKIFGYAAEEMIGQSIKRLLPMDRQGEEDEILLRLRSGGKLDHIETTRICKDGSRILVSLTISPIRDSGGRVVGASKVARDITLRHRVARQTLQSQKMEAIGQLTGGIAHDFNNLLGVVLGNMDLMEPLVEGLPGVQKRLATAQKAAMRGADLTRRLLAFSSNEDLNPTLISLEHSIRNTLELAQRALGPGIRVVVEFDDAVPEIMVDRAGLETVLLNLMLNSHDAMPEGGVLTVTTRVSAIHEDDPAVQTGQMRPGQYAWIMVSDTGHGMSRETLERVFEPFFTTKPRGRGTGLGLAMAYGFVKQSGGIMKIYSEPGFGTSVSFCLPIARPDAAGEVVEADSGEISAPLWQTVLIVDDEVDLLEIASVYVEAMGCTVLKAVDGMAALKLLESHPVVHLMITDIVMPGGLSGVALTERVRFLRPQMKVIYCSGFPADALADQSMPMTAGPLLRKPYQRAELQGLVRRVLEGEAGTPEG